MLNSLDDNKAHWPKVIIESPYRSDLFEARLFHIEVARTACRTAVKQGLNPICSHLFYPQFLIDTVETERETGIRMGFDMADCVGCQEVWIISIEGVVSEGVDRAVRHHKERGRKLRYFIISENGQLNELGRHV